MGIISTPFITYREINVKETDLFEDAFGLNYEFHDVICLLRKVRMTPSKKVTKRLIEKINNKK